MTAPWTPPRRERLPDLPLVPAHLRAPRNQPSGEKRIRGTLSSALDKASRPLGRAATSRPVDNRLVNNPLSRAVGNIAELRPRPRTTFPRGRFDPVFVDGSWLALGCSFRDDMEALIAAFHYGR
ncbi:hypothetical protein DY245_38985 [Streptomyces inhibens]|uniref:Uncharacterized protein n=1 Tax=Streptomyces inhibens TaxID=2293571 RepID=A0A371PSM9_STRIH|nr:hypothetical protein [Streptomyces inhibens]REK85221.1 hypothetical protein DY245_38985 [Streptomyces inhibens]